MKYTKYILILFFFLSFRPYGDVNGDYQVTITDLIMVNNHVNGTSKLTPIQLLRADLNRDGEVNYADITILRNILANK